MVYTQDDEIEVITTPEAFSRVKEEMAALGLMPYHAEITFRADSDIVVDGDTAIQVRKLLDILEDLDDVQDVYSNVDQVTLGKR